MNERFTPRSSRAPWIDLGVATLIGVVYVALLLTTTSDLGYARDEGFYFDAARSYQRWFELLLSNPHAAFVPKTIDAAWSSNHEHPALLKSLFALSNLFLQKRHHLFALEGTSFRFPAMLLAGLLLAVSYAFTARRFGRAAAVVASLGLGFMPGFFHHAHLACFDVPIVAMFAFTAFAYAKSLETKGVGWPLVTAIFFGLALDTKHNAWFLPIAGTAHFVCTAVLARLVGAPVVLSVRRSFFTLAAMGIVGPLVFYALWPWIWHDTIPRLHEYVSFHTNHEYYNMEFLGENYWKPPMPRGYAWLMTLATVPTITLLLGTLGLAARAVSFVREVRAKDPLVIGPLREDLFLALCLFASYGAWLSTGTPIFGGTKHWMTAYPFLCIFGAHAFCLALGSLRELLTARAPRFAQGAALAVLAAFLVLAAPVVETLHAHPFGLSAYVPIVGGAPGGASLGLNRSFWGYTTGSVAPYLNRAAPKHGRIYIHDTAWQAWLMLQEDGTIRKDLVAVGSADQADFVLYHHELHMEGQEYQAWVAFGTAAPAEIAGPDGVPVILVYARPKPNPR
jgi:4-amino-4-deoxy-L-arabinose transferase-like glycosyltransferase